jgi:Xylose isomerase-like TIM barrel
VNPGRFIGGPLHRPEELPAIEVELLKVARLASALGAAHIVFLPAMYRDLADGRQLERAELDEDQWRALVEGADRLARVLRDATGMRFAFHPHAESHVETDEQTHRFLADTDPELVACAWTPSTSPTGTVTRRVCCASTPTASGMSTSRPSIPVCWPRSRPSSCRSQMPSSAT